MKDYRRVAVRSDAPESPRSRRAVLAGGLVLAAAGLVLPGSAAAGRRSRPPGRGLLKNVWFAAVGNDLPTTQEFVVSANGVRREFAVRPGGDEWNVHFDDDEGWLVVRQGTDTQGRPIGYGIRVNNPVVGEVWFSGATNVAVVKGGVHQGRQSQTDIRRRTLLENEAYEWTVPGAWDLRLERSPDTFAAKVFSLTVRPPSR